MILSGCHGNSNPKHNHPLNNCPLSPTPIHNIDYTLIHPFSPLILSTNDSGKNKQLLTMEAEKLEFELPPWPTNQNQWSNCLYVIYNSCQDTTISTTRTMGSKYLHECIFPTMDFTVRIAIFFEGLEMMVIVHRVGIVP